MEQRHRKRRGSRLQAQEREIQAYFSQIDASALFRRLRQYHLVGRKGYPAGPLWRAYLLMFILNLPSTNALIRLLHENRQLRRLCKFRRMPHRTTFNRFIQRLGNHPELVEQAINGVTCKFRDEQLTDLGQTVAVDSTVVRSHSNPNRHPVSDPEASWTAKTSARAKEGGKDFYWGFKAHMVADAKYGVPLAVVVTTASRHDSRELPTVIEKAMSAFPWFRPAVVIADKGYQGMPNFNYIRENGAIPVIPLLKPRRDELYDGIYTTEGVPTCLGNVPMCYVRTDPKKGHIYRCRKEGCHLKDSRKGGIRHCDTEVWEDPSRDPYFFGVIRRGSKEWKDLYDRRQAIERVFKSMKESRRLERHHVRGLRQIRLHCLMSTLAYQVSVLVNLQQGRQESMCWMVEKVP